ncbi:MAG: hypothetical protein ACI9KE_000568, partial [Polyangiales bacterium]
MDELDELKRDHTTCSSPSLKPMPQHRSGWS